MRVRAARRRWRLPTRIGSAQACPTHGDARRVWPRRSSKSALPTASRQHRSFTPSVLQLLANYVECMGNSDHGSITGILTVLVDGDDFDEPDHPMPLRSSSTATSSFRPHARGTGHFPAIASGRA